MCYVKFKKFVFGLVIIFLVVPINVMSAITTTENKTIEWFIGQDSAVRASGEQISFYFTVNIPESPPTVKSAWIEIEGVSYNDSGTQTINVDLQQGTGGAGTGVDYTIGFHQKARRFKILYDGWQSGAGPMSNIAAPGVYSYTLYIKGASSGGSGAYSIYSADLKLNYDYLNSGTQFLKTTKFFAMQEPGATLSGTAVCRDFTITIGDLNPQIRSAWIEASGIASGSGSGTISTSVVEQGQPPNWRNWSIDLGSLATTTPFRVLHDATDVVLDSHFPGAHSYTLCVKQSGFTVNLWRGRAIVTYEYTTVPVVLPISGALESSTFDTQVVNGAALNSIMFFGNLNGGKARLQVSASNDAGGPWNFIGPDCAVSSEFEMTPNVPQWIQCAEVHNKRYFRYRIKLCSNDCVSAGNYNPEARDVILNWSP